MSRLPVTALMIAGLSAVPAVAPGQESHPGDAVIQPPAFNARPATADVPLTLLGAAPSLSLSPPVTFERRTSHRSVLLLSLYAFGVFGYVTAALASFFIGRDAERDDAEIAGRGAIEALRTDIAALRESLDQRRA